MKLKLFIISTFLVFLFTPAFQAGAVAPIKILLVPGHDDEVWGAQYGNIKEADMNLRLALKIYDILKKDKRFEVHITRKTGEYIKEFADYFTNNKEDIISFRDRAKATKKEAVESGDFIEREGVPHNSASEDVSIILYGINKWANENKMDAVLHIHFNDYPRQSKWTIGKHKGFAVYVPEGQMVNSVGSISLASDIFTELRKKYSISTYEKEKTGLVLDQSLIALGSNGTLLPSVRSVLVEYGYIYRFKTKKLREASYTNMSNATATALKKYFFKK